MNVIVIGGCHVGNYGVPAHLGFVQQWATHLKMSTHEPVNMTCLSMVKLEHMKSLLIQYQSELAKADLIILQVGHYELSWRKRFSEIFKTVPSSEQAKSAYRPLTPKPCANNAFLHKSSTTSQREQAGNRLKAIILSVYQQVCGQIPHLRQFRESLTDTFGHFTPYQNKTLVLTPFPTHNSLDHWLRRQSIPMFIDAGSQTGLRVADTFGAIPRQKTYFLTDGVHLNSLGHMVVALLLSELPLVTENPVEQPA